MSEAEEYDKKLLERISMFNDAVYAIVLTLLVLELHLPELADSSSFAEMLQGLSEIRPELSAFVLSVLLVGGNWIASVNVQRVLSKTNELCLVLSVTYLIIISLFPFTCEIIGSYPDNPGSYLIFGALASAMTINAYIWMGNIYKNKLLHKNADYKEWKKLLKRLPFALLFLIVISFSAFISTKLSFILFLIANILPFILTRSFKLHHKNETIE